MTVSSSALYANDAHAERDLLLTDFSADTSDLGWYVVNDNVMGGLSDGDFTQTDGKLHFSGYTNTRGGGFSSIRTRALQLDLSIHTGIRLRIKGDGRRYTWRLSTGTRWRGREVNFWANFETRDGDWHTVDIPFSSFVPKFRGFQLEGPVLDPADIRGMGLMIYDRLEGPFELELASVQAYSANP